MPIESKITARVAVQMKVGVTPTGLSAHRTTHIRNVEVGLTEEQVMALVDEYRACFDFPVSKIRYQILKEGIIWLDEENRRKLERRLERAAAKEEREAKKAEKAAAKAAKAAAKNPAQTTLFDSEADANDVSAPAAQKQKAKPAKTPAPAKGLKEDGRVESTQRTEIIADGEFVGGAAAARTRTTGAPLHPAYLDGKEKEYRKILNRLIAHVPAGSSIVLPFEQLVEAGIPGDFLEFSGITPQQPLTMHIDPAPGGKKKNKKNVQQRTAKQIKEDERREKNRRQQQRNSKKKNRPKKPNKPKKKK